MIAMQGTTADNSTATGDGASRSSDHPHILIVDDNAAVTRALARLLEEEGYQTSVCHSGTAAMETIKQHSFAAAVVDIHLPDISGLVLSTQLRMVLGPERPIIILSGDTSGETIGSLKYVGATYFLSKPLNSDHFMERLREMVGGVA